MPYIKPEQRERLFTPGETPHNAGELNFIISLIIDQYWHENGKDYQAFNDILGVLSGVEHEYYRRKIAYYETQKMFENGDVFRAEKIFIDGEGTAKDAKEPSGKGAKGAKVPTENRASEEA